MKAARRYKQQMTTDLLDRTHRCRGGPHPLAEEKSSLSDLPEPINAACINTESEQH